MKVKAIKDYFDVELNKAIKVLDEYEVSSARGKLLSSFENAAGEPLVEIVKTANATAKKSEKKEAK